MEDDEDSTCTTSLSTGSERKKRGEFRQQIDAPPAYSLSIFCTKKNTTKWNPILLAVAAGIAALLVCLVIGGLLFEVGRLNGVIVGQKAEINGLRGLCEVKKVALKAGRQAAEPNEDESTVEVRECWARVANVTQELVGHKARNRVTTAEIARLEAEAVGSRAKLDASHSRTKKLEEEKNELNGRIKQLESQLCGARNGTSLVTATNLVSNSTAASESSANDKAEECSYFCEYVMWFESTLKKEQRGKYSKLKTFGFIMGFLLILVGVLMVGGGVLFFLGVGGSCAYKWGCDHYKQRPPPPRFWFWSFVAIAVPVLLIVLFFYGVAGLRNLINACLE